MAAWPPTSAALPRRCWPGLSREPVTTFAAADDLWILDARLRAERDEHLAVLAAAPPDRTRELRRAEDEAREAAWKAGVAADELALVRGAPADVRAAGRRAPIVTPGAGERRGDGSSTSASRRPGHRLPEAQRLASPAHRCPRRRTRPPLGSSHPRRRAPGRPAGLRHRASPLRPGPLRRPPEDDRAPRPGVARDGDEQRRQDSDAVAELDGALDHTRAARVRALASGGEELSHLVALLGAPPAGGPGRAASCGLALQVEAYRDRHPDRSQDGYNDLVTAIGPRPSPRWGIRTRRVGRLEAAPGRCAGRHRRRHRARRRAGGRPGLTDGVAGAGRRRPGALDAVRSSPLCPAALQPERDLGVDRGMSLGF